MSSRNGLKIKSFEKTRYLSNECISEQDFLSIRVSKDILEYGRVRGGSVLRAHRRETRLTVYSAHSVGILRLRGSAPIRNSSKHRAYARFVQSTTETVGILRLRGSAPIRDFCHQKVLTKLKSKVIPSC